MYEKEQRCEDSDAPLPPHPLVVENRLQFPPFVCLCAPPKYGIRGARLLLTAQLNGRILALPARRLWVMAFVWALQQRTPRPLVEYTLSIILSI
jgi:hypothetical protein